MRLRKKAWAKPLLDDYTNRIVITKLDFLTNPIKDVFKNDNKLVLEIDLDKENTETDFNQAYYKVISSTADYPVLNQDDIVGTNSGIYQYELARFRTTINGITDFSETKEYIDFEGIYEEIQKHIDDIDNGSLFATKEELNTVKIPIGSGVDYYGSIAPEGFLFADGRAISRTEYSELYKTIGTTYGVGDGSTTFNLPDKRSRVSVMINSNDSNFNALGKKVGSNSHILTAGQLPKLSGTVNFSGEIGRNAGMDIIGGATGIMSRKSISQNIASISQGTSYVAKYDQLSINFGNNEAHPIIQQSLVCNYIIRVK